MSRAKEAVRDRVEMLGVDAGIAMDLHASVVAGVMRIVIPAVNVDFMAAFDQADRDLLDVALDAAVSRRDPLLPDHGDLHRWTSV